MTIVFHVLYVVSLSTVSDFSVRGLDSFSEYIRIGDLLHRGGGLYLWFTVKFILKLCEKIVNCNLLVENELEIVPHHFLA